MNFEDKKVDEDEWFIKRTHEMNNSSKKLFHVSNFLVKIVKRGHKMQK
jgi:hypothetical protein